jgi:hypothetical protein
MFPLIDRKERLHKLVKKSARDRLLYAQQSKVEAPPFSKKSANEISKASLRS